MRKKGKIILFIFIFIVLGCSYLILKRAKKEYIIETDNEAIINELYIYGNHLNLNGTIHMDSSYNNFNEVNLLLFSKEEIRIPLNYQVSDKAINFQISDKINNGFLLDNLKVNSYNMYIEIINKNQIEYYKLNNKTNYEQTEYYTIRKNNLLKYIQFTNKNATINLNIKKVKDDNIYDIVIDPGHGGVDKGACSNGYCEIDFTYLISSKIKDKLEENNLKVKLTRNELNNEEQLSNYGKNGRIDIANESKAKYLLAIHLNSNAYNDSGLEIYTAYNVDYTFATNLASSIIQNTNTKYSTNNSFKKENGIYTRTFQNNDLSEAYETAITNGYEPYDISNKTTYYFIIRETGGYMSGAYMDGRDGKSYNYQSNSNVGRESYLVELVYLTSKEDVDNITNNIDSYVDGIVDAIIKEIESEI